MKVITLNSGSQEVPLRADNTSITADNTDITADSTILVDDNFTYSIYITPREYFDLVDFQLINELDKSVTLFEDLEVETVNQLMKITFTKEDIKNNTTYRAYVFKSGDLLWRGKVFATNQTDLQKFKMNLPDNNNKIIM